MTIKKGPIEKYSFSVDHIKTNCVDSSFSINNQNVNNQ